MGALNLLCPATDASPSRSSLHDDTGFLDVQGLLNADDHTKQQGYNTKGLLLMETLCGHKLHADVKCLTPGNQTEPRQSALKDHHGIPVACGHKSQADCCQTLL